MAQVLLNGESRFLSPCDFKRVRRCKTVTFDNFCAISLATALEHHSANQFLKAEQTSMLSNRNCFKLLVKMISASPIARCPSFKFLTTQMQPFVSWVRDCRPFYP